MPTTSNFGWTTPADTDLVKDGALAIRTLGNGIDTSFLDLKGGTTGQILSKASNTDLDYTWINNDQGDITEVQAGTGISVASGTGPIPIVTNTVATAFDAKGDLIGGTGADTFARLAVGANNTVLTADSTTATGLKWATPTTASFIGCQAINDNFSVSYTQYTDLKIPFAGTDIFDTDAFHDSSTNNTRITIPTGKGGKYLFNVTAFLGAQNSYSNLFFLKNNAVYKDYFGFQMYTSFTGTANGRFSGSVIANMAAGDYAEVVYNSDKATGTITGCYATFSCVYLGA